MNISNLENEFFNVIETRKTIRKYSQEIPPLEAIKKIANSGRLAPCATNTQNWEFIAIYNNDIKEKMANAVENIFGKFLNQIQNQEDKNKINAYKNYATFFTQAPVLFVIIEKKRTSTLLSILERAGMNNKELQKYDNKSSILSMGAAIENMSLAAHALGLSTCWLCAPLVAKDEFKQILNLNEDDNIVSLLTIGYPDKTIKHNQPQKKLLDEVFKVFK